MPQYSSRRPSTRRDHPLPRIFENRIYEQPAGFFASYDTYRGQSYHYSDSRRHDTHSSSRQDSYSQGFRHGPSTPPCCSPDNPHPLRDLDRGDPAYHYFERITSRTPICCSPEYPHPLRDLDRGDPAYHYFEKIPSTVPPQRETVYDRDQHRRGAGGLPHRTSGVGLTKDRESRYQSDPSTDFSSHEEKGYFSNRDQDSNHYPQAQRQRSEHHPRRASSTQKQSYTSAQSARPRESETRRESATGKRREETREYPKPESKAKSSRTYHDDRNEYESKRKNSRTHHHGDDRKEDKSYGDDRKERKSSQTHRHGEDRKEDRYHGDDRKEDKYHGEDRKEERYHGDDRKEDRYHGPKHREDRHHKSSVPPPQPETPLPDHYQTLGISSRASADEIKKAARSMRVSTHPDKLKKPGLSEKELRKIDERAAMVGQAADVLQNKDQKESYDRKRAGRSY